VPGPAGPTGATGPSGPTGATGPGVAAGGAAGQVLTKINATDYNTQWTTPSTGDVTKAYVDTQDALRVAKSGDTMTGGLTISLAWPGINLIKPASGSGAQLASYTGGNLRWVMALGDSAAESGANAGSAFALARYSDAGAYLDAPIQISRATGALSMGGNINYRYTAPGAGGWYDTSTLSQRFFVGTEGANDHFRIYGAGAGINLLTLNGTNGIATFTGGLSIGTTIATGLYGDTGNIALRGYSTGSIYFQNASGATTYGYMNSAGLNASGEIVAGGEVKVRGNVIRFGDDNIFMYFNGSQFQFSHALSATATGYLPTSGGTITGNLGVNGTTYVQEIQLAQSASGAGMWFAVPGYGNRFYLGTEGGGDAFRLYTPGYGNALYINGAGDFSAKNISSNTHIHSTNGYRCRPGQSDPGYTFSIDWPGGWFYIGGTAVGQLAFQSDYRIKKDIQPLKSMWEQVRKLNPISYTPKEYTPPSLEATAKSEGKPFVVETNIEHWGFIAHELQDTLLHTAANGRKDDPDVVQSLAWPPLVAALTKALQEAMARIEVLEGKVLA